MVARGDRHSAGVLALLGRDAPGAEADRSIADVVWAACLAVEASDRVELVSTADGYVAAAAVNDLAHLLAEILENAAQASGGESRVTVLGEAVDIGYLVTIVDRGAGMDSDDLAEANRRAGRAVAAEQIPSRALGLDIVGRLARRHGMLVRLGEAAGGGIVVRVEVPAMLLAEAPTEAAITETLVDEARVGDEARGSEVPVRADDAPDDVDATVDASANAPDEPEVEVVEPALAAADVDVAAVSEIDLTIDEPTVVAINEPAVTYDEVVGISVPSIVIDTMPYVVRVNRPHDELLPTGPRKKRWAAALAKVGADN
jgi:hypothetical protein